MDDLAPHPSLAAKFRLFLDAIHFPIDRLGTSMTSFDIRTHITFICTPRARPASICTQGLLCSHRNHTLKPGTAVIKPCIPVHCIVVTTSTAATEA